MAGRSERRISDGSEAWQHLRKLLLATNAHHVCRRRHESIRHGFHGLIDSRGKDCARKKPAYKQRWRRIIHGVGTVVITDGINGDRQYRWSRAPSSLLLSPLEPVGLSP